MGGVRLTPAQERTIREARARGAGYRAIAAAVGLERDTVRYFCKRHGLDGEQRAAGNDAQENTPCCPACGQPIAQPREAGAEDSAATPAAARGGRNTPRRFIAAMRRLIPEPAPIVERRFRRMEMTTAGIVRTPAIFQTASIRQRRTGVQLSDRYLDIRPHMSDV